MALSQKQFESLKAQLQKKKDTLGDEGYQSFLGKTAAPVSVEAESTATFPASPTDSPLTAGAKAIGNVPSSAFGLGKSIVSAVASPIETTKGVFRALVGGGRQIQEQIQKGAGALIGEEKAQEVFAIGENEKADATFDALKDSLIERYGSLEAAQKTATEDPVGFGADVVGIFAGVTKVPVVAKATQTISDVNTAAKASVATKVSGKLDDIAVGQMQKAINLNPTDIRRIRQPNIAGKDPAEWLLERDFTGSQEQLITKLDDYRAGTKDQVDTGLTQLTETIPVAEAQAAQKTLQVLKETFDGTIGNEQLVKGLDDMLAKGEYTLTELNDIKRMAQAELSVFKSTGVLKESAKAKGLNKVVSELKTLIEDKATNQGFDAVKELNKETQVAKEISDSIKKRTDVQSKLPELGLRDGILAIGGFAAGGLPTAAGIIISKKVLESAQFRTFLANKLKSAPEGTRKQLESAIETKRYVEVLQYLAPIANEFEKSQTEVQ